MSTTGFFLGGMLGRIAGPIAQDWFRYKTKLGRDITSREEEAKKRMSQNELENKLKLSAQDHKEKLAELDKQYLDSRKRAEEQMYIAREEWQQKLFWEKCFPLRNPYELPLGYEPVFDESKHRVEGRCRLSTVTLPNQRQIVPLRIITALKDNTHSSAISINGDLSMFLVNNFAANGIHAVVSDIGSWREDAPINDASINYLFKGAKGQPTMVIMPTFTNNGSTVRLKVWSWGLGEELSYPIGFDFGWYNIDAVKRHVLYSEIKNFKRILERTELSLPPEYKKLNIDIKKLSMLEKFESSISEEDFDNLLLLMDVPDEIKNKVEQKSNEIISSIFSCLAGMQADSYHLSLYGTIPLLPYKLHEMKGIELMLPFIRDFYLSLVNGKTIEGVITHSQAASIELQLAKEMKLLNCNPEMYEDLLSNVRLLNGSVEGADHLTIVEELRALKSNTNKLLDHDRH